MRVLAHIHTFNDAGFIQQAVNSLERQTRPPDAIVIVDNASTDGTLDTTFSRRVRVVRNPTNLGTSGAIGVGFSKALEEEFDWTWVLDPDSVPQPDALENLLTFFEGLPPSESEQVCFLACRLPADSGGILYKPMIFTNSTIKDAPIESAATYTRCDFFLWSGCLFRMRAVVKIGLPSADYFTDLTELEYGYRARGLGFKSYVVHSSVLHQDVGRPPGVVVTPFWKIGRLNSRFMKYLPSDPTTILAICSIFGCISADRSAHEGLSGASLMSWCSRRALRSGRSATVGSWLPACGAFGMA